MKDIPIEQMDERRLRVELASALTANQLLFEANIKMTITIEKLKGEVRTLQKAREREKYTLRQKQTNAQRLDIQIKELREKEQLLDALEDAGVDNWEGYEFAMEILRKVQNEAGT